MDIVFLFYEGMTALDAIGPHEVLCRLPGVTVKRVAKERGEYITDSHGLILKAEYKISDISQADVLLVPGAGSATTLRHEPKILDWIRMIHATTRWTTAVCTGSLILGAAGLLSGVNATSHWAVLERLSLFDAIPVQDRVVEDGKVITAAGVSAGIDMALLLASKLSGQRVAEALQLGIEYDPHPPFDKGSVDKADPILREELRKRMMIGFDKM